MERGREGKRKGEGKHQADFEDVVRERVWVAVAGEDRVLEDEVFGFDCYWGG